MSSAAALSLVCPARDPSGLARMAGDDDRQPRKTKARHHRPDRVRRRHAPAGLCGDRPLRRSASPARQAGIDRHHGDHLSRLGPDAVAGHRIRDAGVLRPRRSRSHHVVAGEPRQRVLGADRGDRAVRDRDGAVAVDALRRRSRDRWRHPMAFRVRRRHRHRPFGRSRCDRDHGRAVPADRPEPHASGRADRGRHHRRRLRHRAAGRGHPFLRYAVSLYGADLRCRFSLCACARQPAVVAGARGDRRWHGAVVADGRRARAARRRDGGLLAEICRHRRQRRRNRPHRPTRAAQRPHFAAVRGNRRCAPRNSCCCGAIRGCCRRA